MWNVYQTVEEEKRNWKDSEEDVLMPVHHESLLNIKEVILSYKKNQIKKKETLGKAKYYMGSTLKK